MSALSDLYDKGYQLAYKNGELLAKPPLPNDLLPLVKENKKEIVKELEKAQLIEALLYLEFGETDAIRLRSNTCKGDFLIVKDDNIPDSITVDCPTFTLTELDELINSTTEHVVAVYQLKKTFKAKVVN